MKSLAFAIAVPIFSLSSAVWAQTSPVVVELFTSQGCASCPPADRLLEEMGGRDDVIPLALHVDYWDYIGWEDEFGDPAHAKRQKAYARVAGRKMVYTPEMIVNGQEDVVGTRAMDLAELIAAHREIPPSVAIDLDRAGATLVVRLRPLDTLRKGPLTVNLVRIHPERTTRITRGENAGQDLDYTNIVYDWSVLGSWDGKAPIEMTATVQGDDPCVVLVQEKGPGAILAAGIAR